MHGNKYVFEGTRAYAGNSVAVATGHWPFIAVIGDAHMRVKFRLTTPISGQVVIYHQIRRVINYSMRPWWRRLFTRRVI